MKSSCGRPLSICYAVPGHNLFEESGPSRNVLSVANALSQKADTTVVFRKIIHSIEEHPFKILEFDPAYPIPAEPLDDSAIRGTSIVDFIHYLQKLKRFVRETSSRFDIILEKSWILSGYLSAAYRRHGIPGVLVENIVWKWNEPINDPRNLLRYLYYKCAQFMIGRYLKRVPAIIAETDALKIAMVNRWTVCESKIHVVDLGVDRQLFQPMDQRKARSELRIAQDDVLLLYVGVMDQSHDLSPVIEALKRKSPANVALHLVGKGILLEKYKSLSSGTTKVVFHGYVPHKMVPLYIASADLCLAPYDSCAFPDGKIPYSMLKVHEYLACGRPVIGVPSRRMSELVQSNVTGFILENQAEAWEAFLDELPTRRMLRTLAQNVLAQYTHHGWNETAEKYLAICTDLMEQASGVGRVLGCPKKA
ncbi:MAG: glycosyltransferase family 4 protein [Desulfobacterales bacterium]|nr:MAG: glycosyltransferase family 4 protein [Desulfobacterales bacterium]